MLEKSVESGVHLDTKQEELQGFFLCCLQCILTNVETPLNQDLGERIVDLIINVFRQRGDVFDEAFLCISAIANKFPNALQSKVEELGGFIMCGIKSKNAGIIRNSCGVLSDLCTLVEARSILEGFKEYMPILLDYLKDEMTEKTVKTIIISLIGDTFLLTKSYFIDYLEESLSLLESAAKVAVTIPKNPEEQPALINYLCELQSALIESYTCFVQNVQDSDDKCYQTLGQFIPNILAFMWGIIDPIFDPPIVSQFHF